MATTFNHINQVIIPAGTRTADQTLPRNIFISADRIEAGTIDVEISMSSAGYIKAGGAIATSGTFTYQGITSYKSKTSNLSTISDLGTGTNEIAAAVTGVHTDNSTTAQTVAGVFGTSNHTAGGSSIYGCGVLGNCDKGKGVAGLTVDGYGVIGGSTASGGIGVYGGNNSGSGYYGFLGSSSYAIYGSGPGEVTGTFKSGTHSPQNASDDIGTITNPWDVVYCNYITCFGGASFAAGNTVTVNGDLSAANNVNFSGLPTSSAGLSAGDLWNDSGTVKVV